MAGRQAAPRMRGCLDGRVVRGATIGCFWLGLRTGENSPVVCRKEYLATFLGLCFSPPLCRRRAPKADSGVFNSPQRSEDYWTRPDYPRRGHPTGVRVARRCRPTPRRQLSPGQAGRDRAPPAGAKDRRHATWRPEATTQERPPALPYAHHDDWCVWQSGGAGSGGKPDKAGANCEL